MLPYLLPYNRTIKTVLFRKSRRSFSQKMPTFKNRSHHFRMEVDGRRNFRPKFFGKTFGPSGLPREDFHVIRLTVAHDIKEVCRAKTATSLPMSYTAPTKYNGGRTVGREKTKRFFFTVRLTLWKYILDIQFDHFFR